jgi:hypothetical protein
MNLLAPLTIANRTITSIKTASVNIGVGTITPPDQATVNINYMVKKLLESIEWPISSRYTHGASLCPILALAHRDFSDRQDAGFLENQTTCRDSTHMKFYRTNKPVSLAVQNNDFVLVYCKDFYKTRADYRYTVTN